MEPIVPHKKLESGVFEGRPELLDERKVVPPRLIRTMKGDVEDAIKNQNETTVSIAIAEEKKKAVARAEGMTSKEAEPENLAPAPKPIGRIVVILIILLIITLLGLAYVFVLPKFSAIKLPSITVPSFPSFSKETPASVATTTERVASLAPSLIPAQEEARFNITKQTQTHVLAEIGLEMKKVITSGSVKNLYFTEGETTPVAISANRLFIFADIGAPEILTRSLEKSFMAGFFGEVSGATTPFVILRVSSYDTGLAGMLEWEANLPRSFDTIFGTEVGVSATSKTKFHDVVVLGKDARAIDTPFAGSIVYAFANESTIVVTGSVASLEALLPLAGKN